MKNWNLVAWVFILSAVFCLTNSGTTNSGGTMIDLGNLGRTYSSANGINDSAPE